ncbi:hypothetical protein C8R48DRAFT_692176 [Suillus tomentosus]|nr:hypothetical protein C8R48DRAFT_692176 [Suillus tomentosus]
MLLRLRYVLRRGSVRTCSGNYAFVLHFGVFSLSISTSILYAASSFQGLPSVPRQP